MNKFLSLRRIHTASLLIQRNGHPCREAAAGGMTADTPFYLASVSKLYTHAILFRLLDAGQLRHDTRLTDILAPDITRHFPHAAHITVRHLLDHTSGLPNHETDRDSAGHTLLDDLLRRDRRIAFADILARQAQLPARIPGGRKAHYADLNALLLGKMAEAVTGQDADALLHEHICQPLALAHTRWAREDDTAAPIRNGDAIIACRQYLASQGYPGGIIAPNRELMHFARAFFAGRLFRTEHLHASPFLPIQHYPLCYGNGMMQLTLAKLVSWFFGGAREIRGHSGISGSFAFYCPEKDTIVTGTLNQLRLRPYPLIFRAIHKYHKNSDFLP